MTHSKINTDRRSSQQSSRAHLSSAEGEALVQTKDSQMLKLTEENAQLQKKSERLEALLQKKGGNSKLVIKSGLGKDEEMMKLEMQNAEQDLPAIKSTLLKQIMQTNTQFETLEARCEQLKQILNVFSASIQYNDVLFLKQTDVAKLNDLMKKLSETISTTSRTEIEVKIRDNIV